MAEPAQQGPGESGAQREVAYALAVRSLLAIVAAQVLTSRLAGVRHRDYVRALAPGAVLGAVVLLACVA